MHDWNHRPKENTCADPEGEVTGGTDTPSLKNHNNIRFLSTTGPDPRKITKLPSQQSILGVYRHASETPFRWRFAGGPMMVRLWWFSDPLSTHQLKKKLVIVGPPLTLLSGHNGLKYKALEEGNYYECSLLILY